MKTVWHIDQQSRIESLFLDAHTYGQLIFDKGCSFQQVMLENLNIHIRKKWISILTIQHIQKEMSKITDLNVKAQNTFLEENKGEICEHGIEKDSLGH